MELCQALIDLFTVFEGSGSVVKPLLNQREEREKQRETDRPYALFRREAEESDQEPKKDLFILFTLCLKEKV